MAWERFGDVEILSIVDASGSFFAPVHEAFPGATPEALDRAREIDPEAFGDGGTWLLQFRCFVIRAADGRLTLVDAGVGPHDSLAASWAPVPGRLPDALASASIDPADVDAVVLTHLHSDHTGWAVTGGEPFFPNAAYLLQRADYDIAGQQGRFREALVEPLQRSGQLHVLDGRHQLAAGVTALPTPGHTPGHQSVLVDSGDHHVVVTGDVLVHAVQLADPHVAYAHEDDPERARITRIGVLDDAERLGALLATAHLGHAYVRVPHRHG